MPVSDPFSIVLEVLGVEWDYKIKDYKTDELRHTNKGWEDGSVGKSAWATSMTTWNLESGIQACLQGKMGDKGRGLSGSSKDS